MTLCWGGFLAGLLAVVVLLVLLIFWARSYFDDGNQF